MADEGKITTTQVNLEIDYDGGSGEAGMNDSETKPINVEGETQGRTNGSLN